VTLRDSLDRFKSSHPYSSILMSESELPEAPFEKGCLAAQL